MIEFKGDSRTFVAVCVDGPLAGKLQRVPAYVEVLMIPLVGGGIIEYDLTVNKHGVREWRLKETTT